MKVKSESEVIQSCWTLGDPMDCSLPGSFIYGIFQARVLEWGAIAFSNYRVHLAIITFTQSFSQKPNIYRTLVCSFAGGVDIKINKTK